MKASQKIADLYGISADRTPVEKRRFGVGFAASVFLILLKTVVTSIQARVECCKELISFLPVIIRF